MKLNHHFACSSPVWETSGEYIPYCTALKVMQDHVLSLQKAEEGERVWLLEHTPVFTKGTSGDAEEALEIGDIPLITTSRGGRITYHGPGQRVAYLMLNLNQRTRDLRAYVNALESWLIETLACFSVEAFRREGRVGLWVHHPLKGESKIAAIGVRVQKWVTSHGIALNVSPDLSSFNKIIPCGLKNYGVTSLEDLGIHVSLSEVDRALKKSFLRIF